MWYDGHWGNGYDGYSMSWNARDAYANGEKPLSRWTKADFVDMVAEYNPDIDITKLNLTTLKKHFLFHASWHHTGMYYQKTDFYAIDDEYVEELTQDDVDALVFQQKAKKH